MTIIQVAFYAFSTLAIASGIMVVGSNHPVRGVLSLVVTFFSMAGIWLLLHAEFLALILVLVYVGAVMTLFLFVVMMLRVNVSHLREGFVRYLPFAILMLLLFAGLLILVIGAEQFGLKAAPLPDVPADYDNLTSLGRALYTDYVYPFEISAVILLTAIVAAISLSHRKPKQRRSQNITEQVQVKRQDRVRLVSIPTAKKMKSPGTGS